MIAWPDDDNAALKSFKKSSLAAALEDDGRTWTFLSWARKIDPPARMILRSDSGESVTFARTHAGLWVRERI